MMKEYKCEICGKLFKDIHYMKTRRFCSYECFYKWQSIREYPRQPPKRLVCKECKKPFTSYLANKYCSKRCIRDSKKRPENLRGKYLFCENCNKTIYKAPWELKVAKHYFCSDSCRDNWFIGKTKGPYNISPKERARRRVKGNKHPNFGKSSTYYEGRGRRKRKDLNNQYFRSRWEANFARVLNYWGLPWEYEKMRFDLSDCTYCPDFKVIDLEAGEYFVEVIGYLDDVHKKKLGLMMKKYPSIKIQTITKTEYKDLRNEFRDKIKNWEE